MQAMSSAEQEGSTVVSAKHVIPHAKTVATQRAWKLMIVRDGVDHESLGRRTGSLVLLIVASAGGEATSIWKS